MLLCILKVFAGVYPMSGDELLNLKSAIERLTLNDPSVSVVKETRYIVIHVFFSFNLLSLHLFNLALFLNKIGDQTNGHTILRFTLYF